MESMNKSQLMMAFQLGNFRPIDYFFPTIAKLTASAVLVPLVVRDGEIYLILTKRTSHLRHHPDQIAFPGGKVDATDINLLATALRENHEELGIREQQVTIFGSLPNLHTVTGFDIKPYIGFIDSDALFTPNPQEVSAVIELPLTQVLQNPAHFTLDVPRKDRVHTVYFKPTGGWPIWGVTAAIIEQLRLVIH